MVSKAFTQRMCIGSAITLFSFFLIYFSHESSLWIPFTAVIGFLIIFSLVEYFNISEEMNIFPERKILLTLSLLYFSSVIYFNHTAVAHVIPLFFLLLLLLSTFLSLIIRNKISIISVAMTVLGMAWITIPIGTAYQVNFYFSPENVEKGQYWLLYALFVTKMCDTVAYFVGSKLGKHPLIPLISPKKTIEGAVGGVLGAVFMSYLFHHFSIIGITLVESLILGILIAFLTAVGDLAESVFKRDAKVKDSNHIPGLGGVLDIMDSLLFTTPFIYFHLLLKWP